MPKGSPVCSNAMELLWTRLMLHIGSWWLPLYHHLQVSVLNICSLSNSLPLYWSTPTAFGCCTRTLEGWFLDDTRLEMRNSSKRLLRRESFHSLLESARQAFINMAEDQVKIDTDNIGAWSPDCKPDSTPETRRRWLSANMEINSSKRLDKSVPHNEIRLQ